MKKHLLGIVITLVMCMALLLVPAMAAEPTETTLAAGKTTTINGITFTAGAAGATVVQAEDETVAVGPFIVVTGGEVSATLTNGQSVTVAYPDGNGGYTNAETIEADPMDGVALTLRAEGKNSVTLNHMESVTISDVIYVYNNSMGSAYITFAFKAGDISVIDHNQGENSGQLTINADIGTTGVLRGVDFPTDTGEVVLQVKNASTSSEPDIILYFISGAISMDSSDAPAIKIGSAAIVSPDENGSINVVISKSNSTTTVDGSALITAGDGSCSYTISGNPGEAPGIAEGVVAPASKLLINGSNVTMEYGIAEQVSGTPVITLPTTTITVPEEGSIIPRITLDAENAITFAGYSYPLMLESFSELTIEDYVGDVKHASSDSRLWINCKGENTCTLYEWGEGGIQCEVPTGSEACINGDLYVCSNDADNNGDDDTIEVVVDAEENYLVTVEGPAEFTYNKYTTPEYNFKTGDQPAVTVAQNGTVSLLHGTIDLISGALPITLNSDDIILTDNASISYQDESLSLDSGWALNLDTLVYSDGEVTITPNDINASYSYGKPGGNTGMLTLSEGSVLAALSSTGDSFIYHEAATGTDTGEGEFTTAQDTTFQAGEPNVSVVFTVTPTDGDNVHSFMTSTTATYENGVCTIGSTLNVRLSMAYPTHTYNGITYTLETEDEDAFIQMTVGTGTTNIADFEVSASEDATLTVTGSVDLMLNGTLEYKVDQSATFRFNGHEEETITIALTGGCVDLVGEEPVQILGSCTYGISGPATVTVTGETSAAVQANDRAILWTIDDEGGLDTYTYLASISGNADFTLSIDNSRKLTISGSVTLTNDEGVGTYTYGNTPYTVTEISIEEGFAVTMTKADRTISSTKPIRVKNVDEDNRTCTLALSRDLYVGGVGMTVGDYLASGAGSVSATRPASGGYAYCESADKLILNNYEYEGVGYTYDGDNAYSAAIYPANGDLTIELMGSSRITNIQAQGEGIFSENAVTISGSGSLDITADYSGINAHGIVIQSGTITVDATDDDADAIVGYDGGDVIINGGNITIEADGDYASGITGDDADVIINGGTITIEAGYSSNGIFTDNGGNVVIQNSTLDISAYDGIDASGKLTVQSGTVTIESEDDGFEALKGIEVRGGNISITSTDGCGLEACGDVVISGGALDITSADEGIYIEPDDDVGGGSVTISGGTVTIETQYDDGIDVNRIYNEYGERIADGSITLSGGTLDITAYNVGLEANGNISITGGSLTIEADYMAMWAGDQITIDSSITMQTPSNGSVQVLEDEGDDYSTIVDSNGAIATSVNLVSSGGSSGGGYSGDDSPANTTTETTKNEDGSTTVTTTDKSTGTVTETTTNTDGSTSVVETTKDGTVTETVTTADGVSGTVVTNPEGTVTEITAKVPASADGESVKLPLEVTASTNSADAVPIDVTVPASVDNVTVTIPVKDAAPGTVIVLVHEDGTEEVVPKTVLNEDGLAVNLDGSATIKVVDNSKRFNDTENHWAGDAITFVSSRELFNGVGNDDFAPEQTMDRAMLATVLWRLEGKQEADVNDTFSDVESGTWYTDAINWAAEAGIITGYGDSYGTNDPITREQMVTILYRLSGSPAVSGSVEGASDWAADAMAWAVEIGLLQGDGNGLNPQGTATRAQVSTILMRYMGL